MIEFEVAYVLPAGDLDDFQFATLGGGILYALVMGLIGGIPPAIRAAFLPVAVALRRT